LKAAPRRAEREIARILTERSALLGYDPIFRIPVLGKTGPDLTTNELNLVIDVKNRLECPKGYFRPGLTSFGNLIGFPISEMELVAGEPTEEGPISKIVERWFAHMDEWRLKYHKKGITALVLHRPNQTPKMPFGKSVLLISNTQKEYFAQCLQIVTQL
jgi:hypothetical protein